MARLLEGKKVIDVTQSVAGPTASMLLAFLGAEVIKVEAPTGDSARAWGPPFQGEFGSLFTAFNRGKKAVKINLSSDEGQASLQQLIREGDIFIQNFRGSAAKRLGIDYETVAELNSNIVYCGITGFGYKGPKADRPGYDALMQAFSGIMTLTGEPDGAPVRTGPGVLDIGAGMFGAMGILAAMVERGEGKPGPWKVDTSLLETAAFFVPDRIASYSMEPVEPHRMGSGREGIVPYENLHTSDGYVLVAAGTERFWNLLCVGLGCPELATDPRFALNINRVQHREELIALLEEKTTQMTSAELETLLMGHGVPCAKINKLSEFLSDPQVEAMGILETVDTGYGTLKVMGMPFTINEDRRSLGGPPREPKEVIG